MIGTVKAEGIGLFSDEVIRKFNNLRIKEILDKLSDDALVERISNYTESHDRWENSGWKTKG